MVQCINPVIYLLDDYRGKSVAGAFYEQVLHRTTHLDMSRGESIVQKRRQGIRQVAGIRWIAQFMDTQKQCHLIKF